LKHIGAGGMGDVYRARDTRLDRTVALKVVRTDFGERFEREAKAISALNHPHICALYDVGAVPAREEDWPRPISWSWSSWKAVCWLGPCR
jgi:serine/threonine protein kinase